MSANGAELLACGLLFLASVLLLVAVRRLRQAQALLIRRERELEVLRGFITPRWQPTGAGVRVCDEVLQ